MTQTELTQINENRLAGCILKESSVIFGLDGLVTADDFQSEPCRAVYEAAKEIAAEGGVVELSSVAKKIKAKGMDIPVHFFTDLDAITPTAANFAYYAQQVAEDAQRRGIQDAAKNILDDQISSPEELLAGFKQLSDEQEARNADKKPLLTCAADVDYEPPRWTIKPYLQRGKGTLLQGDNGCGKTVLACGFAALVSSGKSVPGLEVVTPGNVVILSVEDDLPVLRGRIEGSGGDLSRCYFMTEASKMTLKSPELEKAVKQVEAKLIIFDPIQSFLGADMDMFRANETRPVLAQLFEMCNRNDCACLILGHNGKNTFQKSAVNLALGSVDIPASMRSILHLIENPENKAERLAIHVKCSNAPKGKTLAYGINEMGGVDWHGFSDFTIDDLETVKKRKEKGVEYESEPLVQVFNQLITDHPGGGFWSYADLKAEGAKILGFPPFDDPRDLKRLLNGPLAKELQKRDGLIVTHGEAGAHNAKGIRIQRYKVPDSYQTKLSMG